jgi:pimeloyl-ACP methyl ester carboxylesterase
MTTGLARAPVLRARGAGEPALLFVHGGLCDRSDWAAQEAGLSPRHRTLSFDLPGHGRAPVPDRVEMDILVDAIDAARRAAESERLILVGHSLGCRLVLESAVRRPRGIVGLVLIEAGLVGGGDAERVAAAVADRIRTDGIEAFLAASFADMFVDGTDPDVRRRITARLAGLDRGFAQAMFQRLGPWDREDARRLLAGIEVPLLALQSTERDAGMRRRSLSPGMASAWLDLVARARPGAETAVIEDVGHFPQIEASAAVNQAIAAFAARCAGASRHADARIRQP